MMIIENAYCANSLNYLAFRIQVDLNYFLGILNSKLLNFVFKVFSTNSNVNGYEVDNLPLPQNTSITYEKLISDKAGKILTKETSIRVYDIQIDLMLFKIFSLCYDECKIIDPEIEKLISKEDYERMSIEELAEYEIKE